MSPSSPIQPVSSPRRFTRDPAALQSREFDLLVVGGGSIGTAIARDAALRGMSVALIEAEDFGSGTVSRSTRLIHGGLRYLELYDFKLVREALREREVLLRTAPHLVHPLPFLTPIYRGDRWSPLMVGMGMLLYDLLSFDKSLPSHRILSLTQTLRLEPGLSAEGLLGGALYYDAQVSSPERWCLAQAKSAAAAGAVCVNHVRAVKLLDEGRRVAGIQAEDRLSDQSFPLRAKITINATGPWAGDLAPSPDGKPRLRRTQGAHLIVPRMTDHAVVLLAKEDGRVFFVVPWEGRTMIGTTDLDFNGDPGRSVASSEEARYLLEETRRVFPHVDLGNVQVAISGVRPLLPSGADHESQVSREHRLLDHAEEGQPGFVSVLGGKLTTARKIAEEVVDLVARPLGVDAPCITANLPLWGAAKITNESVTQATGIATDVPEELAIYGTEATQVLGQKEANRSSTLPTSLPDILKRRLLFGVQEEMAMTTADLLLRRTLAGYEAENAKEIGREVSRWLGGELNRTSKQVEEDFMNYLQQLERLRVEPNPSSGGQP